METATARTQLEEMLGNLDRAIAILRGEHPGGGERSAADAGANLTDADRTEAMLEVAEKQRAAVVGALRRIEAGTYGDCVDCGNPVPEGRLEARPEADRCVACQSKRERTRR